MTASFERLQPLPRPSGHDRTSVPRLGEAVPAYDELGPGCRVVQREGGEAIVRFWHHASAARAVALAVSGWFVPDQPDACDLDPAGDGWWTAAFRVPDDWQAAYQLVEHDGDWPPPWHTDGLHRRPRSGPERPGSRDVGARTVVRLPEGRTWALAGESGAREEVVTLLCERPGDPRVRLWRSSSGDARVPLVVFFDGEAHLDRMHTPAVLRAAEREGLLPGIAAVFVDAGARRAHDLGLPGGQSEWVASRLVPRLHREGVLGEVAPEQTIVVGSSFGGLSALFALAHARGTITAAVAQSTSFWRFPDALDDALARAYSGTGMRVRLQAGRYEGAGPARSRALAERLADVGVDASARVVSGGHDWTWWVPEAVIDLGRLLRSPTEAPEAAPRPSR